MSTHLWFPATLALALLLAGPLRADPEPGCAPSAEPGCGGCLCEACVCSVDPFCCTSEWDPMCVVRCIDQCGGCGAASSCGDGVCAPDEGCDTCPFDCGDCPVPCGDVTVQGCCIDDKLVLCVDGTLHITNCDGSCGWSLDEKAYVCGGGGPDPAGVYPLTCPAPPVEEDVSVEWPEVCAGLTWKGCCKGTTLFWCDGLALQTIECAGNPAPLDTCGWVGGGDGHYDCGGQGSDPEGVWVLECDEEIGEVVEQPPEAECTVGETIQVGCGGVSFSGCCTEEQDLVFCEGGELLCALHCAQLPSPLDTCGWKQAGETGFYDCGGDGIDPSGQNPIVCQDWTPAEDVVTDGGDDAVVVGCPGLPSGGCCDGPVLHYCEDGAAVTFDCTEMAVDPIFGDYVFCGLDEATGKASCVKKEDATPLECEVTQPDAPPEPAPDIVEPPQGDVVSDVSAEVFEVLLPDGAAGPDLDGAGPQPDVPTADLVWTWPDTSQDTADGAADGGGKGGCATGNPGGPLPLVLLFGVFVIVLRNRRFV